MKLHAKSLIQRLVAKLPDWWANEVYYLMQRRWGRLQKIDPLPYLRQSLRLVRLSRDYWPAEGPKIIEVGTGRTLNIPFGLWLAGAASITTFDLHRYLRPELIAESLSGMRQQEQAIRDMFVQGEVAMRQDRFASLLACRTASEALTLTNIDYVSPADATATKLKAECADLHVSVNVLEHVPPPVLLGLLKEASRVLRKNGRAVHLVDPSDHFAHTDPGLNLINFLRYSTHDWERIAGNQFMYQNRLRASNYLEALKNSGLHIDSIETVSDQRSLDELAAGFPVHLDFSSYAPQDLATVQLAFSAKATSAINHLPHNL